MGRSPSTHRRVRDKGAESADQAPNGQRYAAPVLHEALWFRAFMRMVVPA